MQAREREREKKEGGPLNASPLTFVVGLDFLLELLHLLVALLLVLLPAEGQRAEIGFVLRLLLLVLTHQRVLVVIGNSYLKKENGE